MIQTDGGSAYIVSTTANGTHYRTSLHADSSIEQIIGAVRAAALHTSPFKPAAIALAVVALIALLVFPLALIPLAIGGTALLIWIHQRDVVLCAVSVTYQFDPAAQRAFTSLDNGVSWLRSSRAVWRVTHEEKIERPLNTTSVVRTGSVIAAGMPANMRTNINVPSVAAGSETLMFLPDVLLLRQGTSFAAVPYASLRVECEPIQFSESSSPPADSKRIGNAWLYANKDGSPDRRRRDNVQIPILEYGRVTLSWRGSGCVLLISNMEAARHFVGAVRTMVEFRISLTSAGLNDLEQQLQASIDRKRRLEELEKRKADADAAAAAAAKTRTAANAVASWIPAGSSATVHGLATGDFVYVGDRLAHLDGYGVEPSLIAPSLPVDLASPNIGGEGMTYWPSYSNISPASRAAFLQWLAGGRRDPRVYIGYVFIFFYGLERRVYEFIRQNGSSADEVLAIAREVARLLEMHASRSNSFASYGNAFLDLIGAIEPRARSIPRNEPIRAGYGLPSRLRVALGELSLAGTPVPAGVAYDWVRSMESLPTPAARCERELELLFHVRYAKQFGDGIVLKPNKTRVEVAYRPASNALGPLTMKQDLPDAGMLVRPLAKLAELAQECCSALDPFSRYLGRNPDARESLAAFALLPDELVEGTHSLDATALASLVQSRINDKGQARLSADELLTFIRVAKPQKVAKSEAVLLAQALEKLGYGMEPDVRLGGPTFEPGVPMILFRRLPDCPSSASDEYALAAVCMRMGVIVSASDDDISEMERGLLEQHIAETLRLTEGERQRLAAHLAWLVDAKLGTGGMKKRIDELPADARRHVGKLLIDIATTDGRVDPREMKMLEKLYALLDLPPADLYRDVHAATAGDDEPVVMEEGPGPAKGFAIPPPPRAGTKLDMSRVQLKIAETRQVASLLGSVFAEDEKPAAAVAREIHGGVATIGTLDAAHSELLRRLAERESWPRDEVEQLAAGLSLLPDGALETINDYAYSAADAPFWEDDDPLTINSHVARELTQ